MHIAWEGGEVSVRRMGSGPTGVLLAHGAGTNQDHPRMVGLRDALAERGFSVLTFNYPYSEAGKKRPDNRPVLLACHRAAAAALRAEVGENLVLGGRSMGGRMATYLAAEGEPCLGLILFAYPLHPSGRPDNLRLDHLGDIKPPMLFVQGTRDALARRDLVEEHVVALATVVWMEGADHSFRMPGRTPAEVDRLLAAAAVPWIASLAPISQH
jgi:predicted alpha/beta-hydrolase family hydrolase